LGQIRIGDEVAAERHEVRVACRDDGFCTLACETAGGDQCTAELWPQVPGCDRTLALGNLLDALDTRFDHVEVGNAQSIKLGHYMAKGRGRVAVRHRTVGAARRDTDAHAIGAPDGDRSPRDLEQEASPILDRATISVDPFVTA